MNPLKPFVLSALSLLMAGAALAQKPAWIEVRRHGEPETAFVGGHTADGQDLYVCRVVNSGDIESGKRVGVQGGTCYVGSYDMERPYSYFEILYGVDPAATWVPFDGAMPENAFRVDEGWGPHTWLCRAEHEGGLHPGLTLGQVCSIGYRGEEVQKKAFQVLVNAGS